MRVFPPNGPTVISYEDQHNVPVPNEGAELPAHVAQALIAGHGFLAEPVKAVEAPQAPPDKRDAIDEMSRQDIVASLKSLEVNPQLPKSTDELRAMLRTAVAEAEAKETAAKAEKPSDPPAKA